MKKIFMTTTVFTSIVALAACGDNVPTDGEGTAKKEGSNALDAASILMKSQDAMEEVKNLQINTDAKAEVGIGDGKPGMSMGINASLIQNVSLDPAALYQEMTATVVGEEIKNEQYVTDKGIYLKDQWTDQWTVVEDDDEMMEMTPFDGFDYSEYLDVLVKFVNYLSYEEKEDVYVVKIDAVDEALEEIAKEFDFEEGLLNDSGLTKEELDAFSFSDFSLALSINKDTFMQERIQLDMKMEGKAEDFTLSVNMTSDSKLSKFNKVDQIDVPQDVIDAAIPFSELEEQHGMGFEDNGEGV
ncbi:DUF6612 family protein [Shouchella lonarensis]|uniref:Lipoprotein n=1 Tax=Shouchella lonarensis TaxID=1464122 RepID=A0A1G6J6F2_9BACI|nr:DUF6612 family protein [Shouchella lonarensis]SDC13526.1 hypothetical protein SAMN05421737_105249 [Shouchella lonarensis]